MAGNNKMLIDATHPEETRVAVVKGNRVEEFDFESQDKHQIRGNIYLAKVTRVEPSLQAAFIEYGGNRHGFLAFSEIHPDYYQIPLADREALLQEEQEEQRVEQEEDDAEAEKPRRRRRRRSGNRAESTGTSDESVSEDVDETSEDDSSDDSQDAENKDEDDDAASNGEDIAADDGNDDADEDDDDSDDADVDDVGSGDAMEEVPQRRKRQRKQYKIQEVIKRRQILLVQVVKEERGNKGAALTTYLSLAGRYCVLMPNTPRGGGISRKITNSSDRKRLKSIAGDLQVPQGMGVIVRTAGASRTKAEINRDFEYLSRLWENVRSLTLKSSAPCLVYEEGSLIKRSIRDLFNKDIGEVCVSGEDGYREAKEFMRMLMPSHARAVQPYREAAPLFAKFGIEGQLDGMMQPEVTLKSGGYIVINQTEALVSIDVNSGRSTREHSIEETALKTNLEAAEEVARQLRLRDLAGLIVIDFIDMDERRNNRSVEKKLKDCLKSDRARIQVGRISHFGLLEMSRQRLRASVLDSTTNTCPHCAGTGLVRAEGTLALQILRAVEDQLINSQLNDVAARANTEVALFLLNHKREALTELEQRYGRLITIVADPALSAQEFKIEKGEVTAVRDRPEAVGTVQPDSIKQMDAEDARIDAELAAQAKADAEDDDEDVPVRGKSDDEDDSGNGNGRRKRRRRRRGGGSKSDDAEGNSEESSSEDEDGSDEISDSKSENEDGEGKSRRRRRGRRGGRRHRKDTDGSEAENSDADESAGDGTDRDKAPSEDTPKDDSEADNKPKRRRRRRKEEPEAVSEEAGDASVSETPDETEATEDAPKPRRKRRTREEIDADNARKAEEREAKKAAAEAARQAKAAEKEAAKAAAKEAREKAKAENPEAAPKRRNTRRKVASEEQSEPPAEEVQTASEPKADEPAEETKKKSGRGGWWQRRGGFF
jgi:ribonuclease E